MKGIKISIVHDDAFLISADVLVLKHAQASFGLDSAVEEKFANIGKSITRKLPNVNEYFYTESFKITNTKSIIFIGVEPIYEFGYKEIREFARRALANLSKIDPTIKSILMTIHGPGYGLDETEAFESQLAGIVDSISANGYPDNLSEIIFVDNGEGRATRLQLVLDRLFPKNEISIEFSGNVLLQKKGNSAETLKNAGYSSDSKKMIFVAMPFDPIFDDSFHYGIQGAVNASGYLCERADLSSFTGDVMDYVKSKISSAEFIIADLTTANPNVYLEVGYAWGLNKKTVLLIKDTKELKFDTQSQRCLPYNSIKDLEAKLITELKNLKI